MFLGRTKVGTLAMHDESSTGDPFHEAAEALRATGRTIEPTGDDLSLWNVDGVEMTDGDLIALALRLGLMTGPERLQ